MSDRLTDEELDGALVSWRGNGSFVERLLHEVRDRREKDLVHAQNHCLDCEGPLVPCDCQPSCPGGMCARKCYATNGPTMPALTSAEVEALRWLREWALPRLDLNASGHNDCDCTHCSSGRRAVSVLDRLTRAAGGEGK